MNVLFWIGVVLLVLGILFWAVWHVVLWLGTIFIIVGIVLAIWGLVRLRRPV